MEHVSFFHKTVQFLHCSPFRAMLSQQSQLLCKIFWELLVLGYALCAVV